MQVVLEGCSGQKKAVPRVELPEALRDLTLLVLDLVSFVDDDVLPLELEHLSHAKTNALKGREADVEFTRLEFVFEDVLSFFLRGDKVENSDFWDDSLEFFLPVGDDRFRDNNKEIVLYLLVFTQECEERY